MLLQLIHRQNIGNLFVYYQFENTNAPSAVGILNLTISTFNSTYSMDEFPN